MKKVIYLLIVIISISSFSNAQEIEMKSTFWGLRFTQNGEKLSLKELANAVQSNDKAYDLIIKGRKNYTITTITSIVGGALIGIPVGQSISDQNPNWTLAYIGGGISLIGIPFAFNTYNKFNEGVDTYNLGLKSSSNYRFNPKFNIYTKGTGIGLTMQF